MPPAQTGRAQEWSQSMQACGQTQGIVLRLRLAFGVAVAEFSDIFLNQMVSL
jgi:hypothetical protein